MTCLNTSKWIFNQSLAIGTKYIWTDVNKKGMLHLSRLCGNIK